MRVAALSSFPGTISKSVDRAVSIRGLIEDLLGKVSDRSELEPRGPRRAVVLEIMWLIARVSLRVSPHRNMLLPSILWILLVTNYFKLLIIC